MGLRGLCKLLLIGAPWTAPTAARAQNADYNGFEFVMPQGVVGEIGSLYLKGDSVYVHPATNDYLGDTDKYLTGSANAGLLLGWPDDNHDLKSAALGIYWRAITPAFRPKDGEPEFEKPVGRFADWLDGQIAYGLTRPTWLGGFKFELGFNYGNISDRGIKYVHRWIHQAVRQPTSHLSYDHQPTGNTYGANTMFAHIVPAIDLFGAKFNWQTAVGAQNSKIMNEYFLQWNTILQFSPAYKWGFERKIIKQATSQFYEHIRHNRYETTFSMLLWQVYQPSVKFISPYLKEDNAGQIYVDLLNITVPF